MEVERHGDDALEVRRTTAHGMKRAVPEVIILLIRAVDKMNVTIR